MMINTTATRQVVGSRSLDCHHPRAITDLGHPGVVITTNHLPTFMVAKSGRSTANYASISHHVRSAWWRERAGTEVRAERPSMTAAGVRLGQLVLWLEWVAGQYGGLQVDWSGVGKSPSLQMNGRKNPLYE